MLGALSTGGQQDEGREGEDGCLTRRECLSWLSPGFRMMSNYGRDLQQIKSEGKVHYLPR